MAKQRSPRDGHATRARLVESASRLFAERGVEAVSIRAVNTDAGLAPAAVHYHFGSKAALLDAVLASDGQEVIDAIVRRADARLDSAAPPTARDIVEVLASSYAELIARDADRGRRWLAIVAQLIQAQDPA